MHPITLDVSMLKALCLTAATKYDSRLCLQGIHVEHAPGAALLVTTDGHRLSVARVVYGGEPFASFIVPRVVIDDLKGKGLVEVEHVDGQIILRVVGQEKKVPAIDGVYPDWRRVCDKDFSGEPAIFNTDYYADLGKARKLLTGKGLETTHIRLNGEKVAVDVIRDDFVVYIMPIRESTLKRNPLPDWLP